MLVLAATSPCFFMWALNYILIYFFICYLFFLLLCFLLFHLKILTHCTRFVFFYPIIGADLSTQWRQEDTTIDQNSRNEKGKHILKCSFYCVTTSILCVHVHFTRFIFIFRHILFIWCNSASCLRLCMTFWLLSFYFSLSSLLLYYG